jgi:hypothetical protein
MVWEGHVLKNGKANQRGEKSGLGLQVLSCCFMLGSQEGDCLEGVFFLDDGIRGRCCKHPTYKLPMVGSMSFFDVASKMG